MTIGRVTSGQILTLDPPVSSSPGLSGRPNFTSFCQQKMGRPHSPYAATQLRRTCHATLRSLGEGGEAGDDGVGCEVSDSIPQRENPKISKRDGEQRSSTHVGTHELPASQPLASDGAALF